MLRNGRSPSFATVLACTGVGPLTLADNIYIVKQMGQGTLGELELVVLLAVLRLKDPYGVTVMREIANRTGRRVVRGAVYITLERLEEKGLVRSSVGEPSPVRGGRAKRIYGVTSDGRKAVRRSLGGLRELLVGLDLEPELIK